LFEAGLGWLRLFVSAVLDECPTLLPAAESPVEFSVLELVDIVLLVGMLGVEMFVLEIPESEVLSVLVDIREPELLLDLVMSEPLWREAGEPDAVPD